MTTTRHGTTDLSAHERNWARFGRGTGAVGLVAIMFIFASVIPIGEG